MAKRTRATRWGGASRRSDPGPATAADPQRPDSSKATGRAPETPESPGGATGRERERQGEEGRLKGLVRYPPGSNGGIHRGPDRYPRVTQAQFMKALAQTQVRKIKVNGKTKTVEVEMAMNADVIRGLQLVAERGAQGRNVKEFLKLLEIEEKVFRNGNGHARNGDSGHPPMPAQFVRAPERPPVGPDASPAQPGVLEANGQEYVG